MNEQVTNKYNSKQERLILPAYGRNIQSMVEYCKTISDKEERQWCAETIIRVMGNIYPDYRDEEHNSPILWNHLAVMADFGLDIDYPVEIYKTQGMLSRPQPVDYPNQDILSIVITDGLSNSSLKRLRICRKARKRKNWCCLLPTE